MQLVFAALLALSVFAQEVVLEAEEAELQGLSVATEREGYSGDGYVTGFDSESDSLIFTVETEAGVHLLHLGVAGSGSPGYTIHIDGVAYARNLIRLGGGFQERQAIEVWLAEGEHTIIIQSTRGIDIDYLRITPVEFEGPVTPPAVLSNPNATEATRSLFQYLLSDYGERILAGQQELRDVEYIVATTGREPAIAGGDLIEYSPSRWERNARPNKETGYASSEDYIAWAGDDGIVSLMWHWNAPTDLVDPDGRWWSGFYTEWTTFNFAEALADTTSERYQLLLRDIDAIAVQLQKFADADVPVLWRPLHEAEGGWFWWGAQGAEPFKELWRLLYDRLTNDHDLNNLIWVFTHEQSTAWYPGDSYVDVVGRDVYADDDRAVMKPQWDQLQTMYGGEKLITLSETGTLPDPSVVGDFGVWWSWFTVWSDWPGSEAQFIRAIDTEYLSYVYGHERVTTRDELPDWRSYSLDFGTESKQSAGALSVFPNPTSDAATVRGHLQSAGEVRVEVFDLLGRRVREIDLGPRPAGEFELRLALAGLPSGAYLVRLRSGGIVEHASVVLRR